MGVRIRRNFKLPAGHLVDRETMHEAGLEIVDRVLERTNRGLDSSNRRFEPYSTAYARHKRSKTVNLRQSGDMQADLDVIRVSATRIEIGFHSQREAEKGRAHQLGKGRLPVRQWLDVPEAWIKDIKRRIVRGLVGFDAP